MFRRVRLGLLLAAVHLVGQQRPIAFVDVTVVPMDRERLLEHQTVVVTDGRIAAMGPARTTKLPKEARRLDGRGKFLMPGLADMHVHMNRGPDGALTYDDYATLFLANGVTTVRCMWGTPAILAYRKTVDQGSVIGPRIYTTGPLTDGRPPVWPGSRVVETIAQAEEVVASDKRAGYDAIKVYDKRLPEVYQALVSTARKIGLPVYGHVPNRVGLAQVLDARQDSIEHVGGYLEALDRNESPDALISATRNAGTWNCVTLVFFKGATPADEAALSYARPFMRFLPQALISGWKNNPQLAALTPYQFAGSVFTTKSGTSS
jgi:hypothetical protein